jgi:murein DD-endopeptidase MepM/ murein hydrolase activator NlpD
MIRFFIFILFSSILFSFKLFASEVENFKWADGDTYLTFLEKHKLPTDELYYNLDKGDQTLTEDIYSGYNCQMLKSDKGEIQQILIPINDELQLHISKNSEGEYSFEAIPIISEIKTESFTLKIQNNPHSDINTVTGSIKLAQIFINAFQKSLNFSSDIHKGDTLAMIYTQRYRQGKPFSMPELHVAMIEMNNVKHFIYLSTDGKYYDEKGKQSESFLLGRPVSGARISSKFTNSRYHPILKKYRAHLGVDFAARPGTPISAAGDGKIAFAGFSRGYGNLIKIQHGDNFLTLYAHQKSFRSGISKGKAVKKGQIIGYVGNTGLSSGPHLHFGLYKNGRAIDPLSVVQIAKTKLSVKEKNDFEKIKKQYNDKIGTLLKDNTQFNKNTDFDDIYYIDYKKAADAAKTNG